MPDLPSDKARNDEAKTDGPLRDYSERLGLDYDALVERAKRWVADNPLPSDLGPEPFNVGKPRPPSE